MAMWNKFLPSGTRHNLFHKGAVPGCHPVHDQRGQSQLYMPALPCTRKPLHHLQTTCRAFFAIEAPHSIPDCFRTFLIAVARCSLRCFSLAMARRACLNALFRCSLSDTVMHRQAPPSLRLRPTDLQHLNDDFSASQSMINPTFGMPMPMPQATVAQTNLMSPAVQR